MCGSVDWIKAPGRAVHSRRLQMCWLRLTAIQAFTVLVASSSCPAVTKISCPLCYSIMEQWNLDSAVPTKLDDYCQDVTPKWRASFETLTGRTFDDVKERTRCAAVAAGLQEIVRAGCTLPHCNPEVSCSTFC